MGESTFNTGKCPNKHLHPHSSSCASSSTLRRFARLPRRLVAHRPLRVAALRRHLRLLFPPDPRDTRAGCGTRCGAGAFPFHTLHRHRRAVVALPRRSSGLTPHFPLIDGQPRGSCLRVALTLPLRQWVPSRGDPLEPLVGGVFSIWVP